VFISLLIIALTFVVPLTANDAGVVASVTAIGRFTIVIDTLDICDGSLETRAVMETVLLAGIT
jgi:hypothetical protein